MSDFALTQKVLKLANSAMYASFGGEVSTVTTPSPSSAMMPWGIWRWGEAAGLTAQCRPQGRGRPAGACARHAGWQRGQSMMQRMGIEDGEEGVVASLLHRLGSLLVSFYLPESWRSIEVYLRGGRSEEEAAAQCWAELRRTGCGDRPALEVAGRPGAAMTPSMNRDGGAQQPRGLAACGSRLLPCRRRGAGPAAGEAGGIAASTGGKVQRAFEWIPQSSRRRPGSHAGGVVKEPELEAVMAGEVAARPGGKPESRSVSSRPTWPTSPPSWTANADSLTPSTWCWRPCIVPRPAPGARLLAQPAAGPTGPRPVRHGQGCPAQPTGVPGGLQPDVFHVALAKATDIFIENARAASIATHIPPGTGNGCLTRAPSSSCPGAEGKALGLLYGDWMLYRACPRR